jgi:RHS repeat-associated protein
VALNTVALPSLWSCFVEALATVFFNAASRFRSSLRVQLATAGVVALVVATLVSACGDSGSPGKKLSPTERARAESVAITEIPPGTEFYLNDAQGTPLVTVRADESVKDRANYHPYGLARHQKVDHSGPFRFLGNERDRGSELSDFKARPYRPELGMFLSIDPVALFNPEATIGKPGMLGAYAYTSGDPINQVDRDGRCGTPYAPPGAGCAQKYGPQLPPAAQKEMERGIMEGTMKALDVVATVDGGLAAVKIARILANPVARKAAIAVAAQGTKALVKRLVGAAAKGETQAAIARRIAIEDDGIAVWAKIRGDSKAFTRIIKEPGALRVTDTFRGSQPPGTGTQLLMAALRTTGVKHGQQLVFEGIINPETVATFRAGGSAADSLLGHVGSKALKELGYEASGFEFRLVRDKLDLIIGVK